MSIFQGDHFYTASSKQEIFNRWVGLCEKRGVVFDDDDEKKELFDTMYDICFDFSQDKKCLETDILLGLFLKRDDENDEEKKRNENRRN